PLPEQFARHSIVTASHSTPILPSRGYSVTDLTLPLVAFRYTTLARLPAFATASVRSSGVGVGTPPMLKITSPFRSPDRSAVQPSATRVSRTPSFISSAGNSSSPVRGPPVSTTGVTSTEVGTNTGVGTAKGTAVGTATGTGATCGCTTTGEGLWPYTGPT